MAVPATPLFETKSKYHQMMRFRFQSNTVSVLAFAILYAPIFPLPGGAGMIVSVSRNGNQSTGGYHYAYSDVDLSPDSLRMGKQSVRAEVDRYALVFRSRDLVLKLTVPRNDPAPGASFSKDGTVFFEVGNRQYSQQALAEIRLYNERIMAKGQSMVDHWKMAGSIPDDLHRIRITTGVEDANVFVAETIYRNNRTAYIQGGAQSGPWQLSLPQKSGADYWNYNNQCTIMIRPGNAQHTLDRKSMPSTSRLLSRFLRRTAVIVSSPSQTTDSCKPRKSTTLSETTVVSFQ